MFDNLLDLWLRLFLCGGRMRSRLPIGFCDGIEPPDDWPFHRPF
jgi:hypothetical protein